MVSHGFVSDCEWHRIFTSDPISVRRTLTTMRKWLDGCERIADKSGDIEIAVTEAVNNIVEHAYGGSDDGVIQIHLNFDNPTLHAQLIDRGSSLPGLKLPKPSLPTHSVGRKDMPEGGFGWFLLHTLTSKMAYCREAERNKLDLYFEMPQTSAAMCQ